MSMGDLPTPRCPAEIVQGVFVRMLMDEGVHVRDAGELTENRGESIK